MGGRSLSRVVAAAITLAILGVLSLEGCKRLEHPSEHPGDAGKTGDLTKDQLADAIQGYIQKEAVAHDGAFPISDEKSGQQLRLTLARVHRDKLAKVGQDHYFACVDFKAPDGKVYDVDFFMKGPDKDRLAFSKFTIHKENGKERYTWHEEGGVWKQEPIETAEQPKEQPSERAKEHPSEHPG